MKFTAKEQHKLNRCYTNLKTALDELATIEHKDYELIAAQRKMYEIEDILHQYIGTTKKGA